MSSTETTARQATFVLVATDHGTLLVPRTDRAPNPDGSAYGVGHSLLTLSRYEPHVVATLRQALLTRRARVGNGVHVLDIGANIGVFTVEMARAILGWGTITAFEPQERLFYALCGNLALNNLLNAGAVMAAVGAESGKIDVPMVDYLAEASFGSLELRGMNVDLGQKLSGETAPVPLITVDELNLPRVDFMKIDVEGMELELLAGAERTLYTHKPILFIEFGKVGRERLRAKLESYNYWVAEADTSVDFLCACPDDAALLGMFT